jgi:hypothetical protein
MISLRTLRRIHKELEKASHQLHDEYPVDQQDWQSDGADDIETIRNLDTALAHIEGWITYRVHNGTDPYAKSGRKRVDMG